MESGQDTVKPPVPPPSRMTSPLLASLLRLQSLQDLPRTGWIQRGIRQPETVAGHVLGVAHLVLALGPRVDPPLDCERALALVLVHDAPEALLGDLPRTAAELFPPGAKREAETRAADRLLGPLSDFARARFEEYQAGATREARFARACDRLQLGVRLLAYRRAGAGGLEEFEETLAGLDCAEFAPVRGLRDELLAELRRLEARPGGL